MKNFELHRIVDVCSQVLRVHYNLSLVGLKSNGDSAFCCSLARTVFIVRTLSCDLLVYQLLAALINEANILFCYCLEYISMSITTLLPAEYTSEYNRSQQEMRKR